MWDACYVHSPLQLPYHPRGWERMASQWWSCHLGDLSLDVPCINMIKCNSSDTEADHACRATNKRLQRINQLSSGKVKVLLRCNYWIIKKADTVSTFGNFVQTLVSVLDEQHRIVGSSTILLRTGLKPVSNPLCH